MSQNNAEALQPENGHIAMSLALATLSTLTDAGNQIARYVVSDATSIEGIVSLLGDVLTDLQASTEKFLTFTENFEHFCENVRAGEIA